MLFSILEKAKAIQSVKPISSAMNLLSLSTLSSGGEGDFSTAWGPDDLHMNRAEGRAGANASVR